VIQPRQQAIFSRRARCGFEFCLTPPQLASIAPVRVVTETRKYHGNRSGSHSGSRQQKTRSLKELRAQQFVMTKTICFLIKMSSEIDLAGAPRATA